MVTRSSLELMLDKLQQLDDQPKEYPPALPARPVSRARLPRPRRPLQLDSQRTNCEENGESKREKGEDFSEAFYQTNGGVATSSAQFDRSHMGAQRELSTEITGIIAMQSFIRGENARRVYGYKRKTSLWAIVVIQKQTRKYFEHRLLQSHLQSGCLDRDIIRHPKSDETQVSYSVLVSLQKQVLRSEARVREKEEENLALKRRLDEMDKKRQLYEERMKSKEKEWQDQFTYIQECLAAGKNGRILDVQMELVHEQELVGEGSHLMGARREQSCVGLCPHDELHKLKQRFKAWKEDYKKKLRDAQSTLKKLSNSNVQKHWWGRLSH